jgi:putative DNA methylase
VLIVQLTYPKRLIEVDLPIKRISAHARREKSIRHGHISTLHIWWARRPLAACRAVICASLWPDPADPLCPQSFRDEATRQIVAFAKASQSNKWGAEICDGGSFTRYMRLTHGSGEIDPTTLKGQIKLRAFLFDFIADFAAWEASTNHWFLDTARALTQAAHEALGGEKGTRPLVVDPFAGGGAIPLEALRVGADAFASDLNPVAVLLNKVVLEYIPKYGQTLADEVRKWGQWVKEQAEKELAQFYPKDADGSTPIAYLWARTIQCEGPGCGAEVPLMRSLWLAKKGSRSIALKIVPNPKQKRVDFEIVKEANPKDVKEGTSKRGAATCPCCGYTTPIESVRRQLKGRRGGALDARLTTVVTARKDIEGRSYRAPCDTDRKALGLASSRLADLTAQIIDGVSVIPDEKFTGLEPRRIPLPQYGMEGFGDLFGVRQSVAAATMVTLVADATSRLTVESPEMANAIAACLAIVVDRQVDKLSSLTRWDNTRENPQGTFGRQALPMVWDFNEVNPISGAGGDWGTALDWVCRVLEENAAAKLQPGTVQRCSATRHPLPSNSAQAVITDPPYYYSVPYSDLSDFFYVWLRRSLLRSHGDLFGDPLTPKEDECVQNLPHAAVKSLQKSREFYESQMTKAFAEARRIAAPNSLGIVVFAHTDTAAWEALVQALIAGGWFVSASWPIDTEMASRVLAQRQSTLASSIHLACRPREDADGAVRQNDIGDWRDVLAELPKRTREWMKRLSEEGVVGADAIFACLGPALEIFSRYSRVEKASGEPVLLKEYLTYVWGAVAQEALAQIFQGADATGFEEDARVTAMWLWTLNGSSVIPTDGAEGAEVAEDPEAAEEADVEDEAASSSGKTKGGGYVLEFDAARKIAQGLGAHLEQLSSVIEVKGDKARLLGVAERTKRLFGKDEAEAPQQGKRKKKDKQLKLFSPEELGTLEAEEGGWGDKSVPKLGDTTLDRIHQSMILFAAGRGEAMRRFLVEDGAGQDQRFWKLANALSALYPQGTDEKRWVVGVLARKKGLGL